MSATRMGRLLLLAIPLLVGLMTSSAQAQTDCSAQGDLPQVECEALVALFNSTNGPGWADNTGWNQDNAPCAWLGVVCGAGNVTSLSLPFNDLSGPIPPEIGNLTSLTLQLNLRSNQLSGPIPSEIGNLTNLGMLNLLGNQLTGPIPPALGNLTNLTILGLAFNQLSGPIPPELANLSDLVTFNLGGNQLSGPVPLSVATVAAGTTGFCSLANNDPSLCMADTPDFQALADQDGLICELPLTASCGAPASSSTTWTLSGVTFADGGSAEGRFEVDFETDTITAWSVSVSGGNESTFPPFTYGPGSSTASFTPLFSSGTGSFAKFQDSDDSNAFGRPRELRLISIAPLTAAGGTMALDLDNGFGAECYNCAPFRTFDSGELVGAASPPPSADLVLEKTDSFDPVVQGQTFRYTLTVTNNGFNTAEGVVVSDTLPAGVTLVSTSGCEEDPIGSPTCSLGSLTAGTSRSIEIEVTVDATTLGQITNNATVTSDTAEEAPGDEAASETTEVVSPPNSDLRLEKTASAAQLASGSALDFQLIVTNDGPDTAVGITVTDTLPDGITLTNIVSGSAVCAQNLPTVTCTIAQLATAASETITISTTIDAATQGELLNMAGLETNGNDPNAANDSSEVTVTVFLLGDLNRDGVVDALDVSTLVQELNDGDGEALVDVATGTFPGTADFDLNDDELITAADIGPLAELLFNPPDLDVFSSAASPQGGTAGSTLDFPRLAVEADNLTGIAIANPNPQDASLTFSAYGENGDLLAQDFSRNIPGGQQLSLLTSDLFPNLPAGTVAWFQATSQAAGLSGFFLELNFASFAELDGADLPPRGRRIVFNTVQTSDGASTELNVINPGNAPANVTLTLIAGEERTERQIQLPAKGVARMDTATLFDLGGEELATVLDENSSYVLAESNQDLLGFEFIRAAEGDLQGLNARTALERLNRIYIPQMAVLGIIESELGLVNYSAQAVITTITAHKVGGDLFGPGEVLENPVTIALGAGESIRRDVAEMFGFQGEETVQGWLEIESTSQAVNGFLAYRVPLTGAAAAVSAVTQGTTTAIFSHLATVGDFYTGVAALNPSSYPVNLRIIALSVAGEVLGTFDTVLAPGQRESKLITEFIPGADEQGGGLILMRTNYPSIFVSLFGTFNGKTFANIPPQRAPRQYAPDMGLPQARVSPPLNVLQPGADQQFMVQGTDGPVEWKVNGVMGGNADTGTVTQTGFYSAPDGQPSRLPITISVEGGGLAAAASVDVLDPTSLLQGLGVVQSLSFLEGLQRLYTAELSGLGPGGIAPQGAPSSTIFEIDDQGGRREVLNLPGEDLSKIVPFLGRDGQEYLLMAGRASGQITRLNPETAAIRTVADGLAAPAAITFDTGGDLLVATATGIETVDRSRLEGDLTPAPASLGIPRNPQLDSPRQGVTFNLAGIEGMAVDVCTRIIYLSLPAEGRVVAFNHSDNSVTEIASGLGGPGHLLGTHRSGLACPDSFNLIIIEETANQLSLAIPSQDTVITPWVPATAPLDLTLLPPSPFTAETSVIFNQVPSGGGAETNEVAGVEVADLYEAEAVNPPVVIAASATTRAPGPDLVVGTTSGTAGGAIDTSIFFRSGADDAEAGGADEGNVLLFTLDYDESRLIFDDSLGIAEIPEGVTNKLAGDFLVIVLHDEARTDGELGFLVVDAEAPFAPIPEQDLFDLGFTIRSDATGNAFLLLTSPGPQLVDVLMALQALDDVVSGGVSIVP